MKNTNKFLKNLPIGVLPSRAEMRQFIQDLRALNDIEEVSIIMDEFLKKYEKELSKNPIFFKYFVYKPLFTKLKYTSSDFYLNL